VKAFRVDLFPRRQRLPRVLRPAPSGDPDWVGSYVADGKESVASRGTWDSCTACNTNRHGGLVSEIGITLC